MGLNPISIAETVKGAGDNLTQRSATQQIPPDLAGMRQNNISLLNSILFGQGQPGTTPDQRLQNVFGSLTPPGIQQFINQPTPETQALNTAMPALQEVLSGNPNQNPQFLQDLSVANQQGGRFGSANAILRGQALTGLFNQREQAANTLGVLSSQAGAGQTRQAGFMDMETQRRLQLLMSLLGTSQSASFNLPFVQQPSAFDTIGQLLGAATAAVGAAGGGGGALMTNNAQPGK